MRIDEEISQAFELLDSEQKSALKFMQDQGNFYEKDGFKGLMVAKNQFINRNREVTSRSVGRQGISSNRQTPSNIMKNTARTTPINEQQNASKLSKRRANSIMHEKQYPLNQQQSPRNSQMNRAGDTSQTTNKSKQKSYIPKLNFKQVKEITNFEQKQSPKNGTLAFDTSQTEFIQQAMQPKFKTRGEKSPNSPIVSPTRDQKDFQSKSPTNQPLSHPISPNKEITPEASVLSNKAKSRRQTGSPNMREQKGRNTKSIEGSKSNQTAQARIQTYNFPIGEQQNSSRNSKAGQVETMSSHHNKKQINARMEHNTNPFNSVKNSIKERNLSGQKDITSDPVTAEQDSKKPTYNNEEETFPAVLDTKEGDQSSDGQVARGQGNSSNGGFLDPQITAMRKGSQILQVLDVSQNQGILQQKKINEQMQRLRVPKQVLQPIMAVQKEQIITNPLQIKTLKSLILNQSERSSGKIRYQAAGKEFKISGKRGKIKEPPKQGVPDQLDEIILSLNDEAEEDTLTTIRSIDANEMFQTFDPNARFGQRGEILLKEMKFLSIDTPRRGTPRELYSKRKNRKDNLDKNRSINATLVPILPPPRLKTPRLNKSPKRMIKAAKKEAPPAEQQQLDCQIPSKKISSRRQSSVIKRESSVIPDIEAKQMDEVSAEEKNSNIEALMTKIENQAQGETQQRINSETPSLKPQSRPRSQKSSTRAVLPDAQAKEDIKPQTPQDSPTQKQEDTNKPQTPLDHTTEGHTVKAGESLFQHGATLRAPARNDSENVFFNSEDTKEPITRHHAELLKLNLNLEINLSSLHRPDDYPQEVQMVSQDETTEEGYQYMPTLEGVSERKRFTLPDHKFSKKFQPIYIFRDQLDVSKDSSRKHNDVVSRVFGARSLSLAAKDQVQINNRISELVPPNKVPGAPNIPEKLRIFQNELRTGFYNDVSPRITSRGTTGRQLGRSPENYRQKFASTLQYGIPQSTVVADNRSTSLFRDYYKVIGSRYKYELEDLLNKQQENIVTQEKYMRFYQKLSAQYLNNRNSPNEDLIRLQKYQDDYERDRLFEVEKQRSSPMTPNKIGRSKQERQTKRLKQDHHGVVSFIPGLEPRTVQPTPNTAQAESLEGTLSPHTQRMLTDGPGHTGTATGRPRQQQEIAEAQSSLFGGTQLKLASSAGRSKENPTALPALSQASKTSTIPKAAHEPDTSSIEDSVLKGTGMRLAVMPRRQVIPLKEAEPLNSIYQQTGYSNTQFDARFTDWNNSNQLTLTVNNQQKPMRQDTLKGHTQGETSPDYQTNLQQDKRGGHKKNQLQQRQSPFQHEANESSGKLVAIVLSKTPVNQVSSGELRSNLYQNANEDLEAVKAKTLIKNGSKISRKNTDRSQVSKRSINQGQQNQKNMHLNVIEPGNQQFPQSEFSQTQKLNIQDIISPIDGKNESKNSFYKERKSSLGSTQVAQRSKELVSIILQNVQHTPDPRQKRMPDKFLESNMKDRRKEGGKFYKKEYQGMQLIGQRKHLQSRSPSDSQSPVGSADGDAVKVIQDRVFPPYSPDINAFGLTSTQKSNRTGISPDFGIQNINIINGDDKTTPSGQALNQLRTQNNGSLEKLTVMQRVSSPIDRIIITQAHGGSQDLGTPAMGSQDKTLSHAQLGKAQQNSLSTEPDNKQISKQGSLLASSGGIREGLVAVESNNGHQPGASLDTSPDRDSHLDHHDQNETPHIMEARGGSYPASGMIANSSKLSKNKSKFGKQTTGGGGQDQNLKGQKGKMAVQQNQQFLPAPKINQ